MGDKTSSAEVLILCAEFKKILKETAAKLFLGISGSFLEVFREFLNTPENSGTLGILKKQETCAARLLKSILYLREILNHFVRIARVIPSV